MFSNLKKIYLMVLSQPEGTQQKDWLATMPELSIIANIEPIFLFGKNSADITPELWITLAKEIHQRLDKADGFVVFHGIDNLLYSSSALSFLLQNLNKPIVFTGGKFGKQSNKKLEIRANLINASQITKFNLAEVGLMFGNRLLRANQASLANDESLNIFTTPLDGMLGRIDFSIRVFDKPVLRGKSKAKLFDQLSDKVEIINLSPTLNLKALTKQLAEKEGV
ncbi:asparaginase, partial [Patescibacteria group bacterium]|nr:asparaginase [Patescibacteria group bacterium]